MNRPEEDFVQRPEQGGEDTGEERANIFLLIILMLGEVAGVVTNCSQGSQGSQTAQSTLGNLRGKEALEYQCGNQNCHENHRDHQQDFLPHDKANQESGQVPNSKEDS